MTEIIEVDIMQTVSLNVDRDLMVAFSPNGKAYIVCRTDEGFIAEAVEYVKATEEDIETTEKTVDPSIGTTGY